MILIFKRTFVLFWFCFVFVFVFGQKNNEKIYLEIATGNLTTVFLNVNVKVFK